MLVPMPFQFLAPPLQCKGKTTYFDGSVAHGISFLEIWKGTVDVNIHDCMFAASVPGLEMYFEIDSAVWTVKNVKGWLLGVFVRVPALYQ